MAIDIDDLSPRLVAGVGLLALAPVIAFALGHSAFAGAIAAVNVLLIVGSLFWAMTADEEPVAHGSNGDSAA